MPYEVTISGGAPWGFRLSGGAPSEEGIRVRFVQASGAFKLTIRIFDPNIQQAFTAKNRETNSAASLPVARLLLPMFALVTTFWPSTCKTSKMLHF